MCEALVTLFTGTAQRGGESVKGMDKEGSRREGVRGVKTEIG